MDSSFSSFVLAFSAGIVAFGVASVALAAVFVQGRFEASRLFGPSVGLVACGLLAGYGRIDFWLFGTCLAGSVLLAGLLLALRTRLGT